jgi:hypothetical protein
LDNGSHSEMEFSGCDSCLAVEDCIDVVISPDRGRATYLRAYLSAYLFVVRHLVTGGVYGFAQVPPDRNCAACRGLVHHSKPIRLAITCAAKPPGFRQKLWYHLGFTWQGWCYRSRLMCLGTHLPLSFYVSGLWASFEIRPRDVMLLFEVHLPWLHSPLSFLSLESWWPLRLNRRSMCCHGGPPARGRVPIWIQIVAEVHLLGSFYQPLRKMSWETELSRTPKCVHSGWSCSSPCPT